MLRGSMHHDRPVQQDSVLHRASLYLFTVNLSSKTEEKCDPERFPVFTSYPYVCAGQFVQNVPASRLHAWTAGSQIREDALRPGGVPSPATARTARIRASSWRWGWIFARSGVLREDSSCLSTRERDIYDCGGGSIALKLVCLPAGIQLTRLHVNEAPRLHVFSFTLFTYLARQIANVL